MVNPMAKVYANLIIHGLKTYKEVPDKIKNDVKEELIAREHPELIIEDEE